MKTTQKHYETPRAEIVEMDFQGVLCVSVFNRSNTEDIDVTEYDMG